MTRREFLNAITTETITEEVKEFARTELEKMDTKNATRKSTPSKTQIENEGIKNDIVKLLTETKEVFSAAAVGEKMGISTQKASALCRQLAETGMIQSEEVKVTGKGKQKQYRIA